MESRVSRLETHMEYVRSDLAEIKGDVRAIGSQIGHLPTKRDLDSWRWQWLATGVGIVALIITGVVGGLALISHYAASGPPSAPVNPQPIVIQIPQPVPLA